MFRVKYQMVFYVGFQELSVSYTVKYWYNILYVAELWQK